MKWIVPIALCALYALLAPVAPAQEPAAEPATEEIVEQILELQRRIEELMATLPPDARAELRRRLAEAPPTAAPAAPAAADTTVAPTAETAVAPEPGDGIPKLIRRRSRRAPCNTLHPLDENGDGKISSADRYWRYFYLWTDRNGDRQLQDREVASAYDRKVRELAVSLETFVRIKGGLGEVRIDDRVVLDLRGDGFSERARRDDGALVVDAGALARGGGPRLLDSGGEVLDGFQPFRSGLRLELAGEVTELNCP